MNIKRVRILTGLALDAISFANCGRKAGIPHFENQGKPFDSMSGAVSAILNWFFSLMEADATRDEYGAVRRPPVDISLIESESEGGCRWILHRAPNMQDIIEVCKDGDVVWVWLQGRLRRGVCPLLKFGFEYEARCHDAHQLYWSIPASEREKSAPQKGFVRAFDAVLQVAAEIIHEQDASR